VRRCADTPPTDDYKVNFDDEDVTARLRQIADRIIKNLPPTELKFQLYLFDINDVNAFTLPGDGFISHERWWRFAQNEDELAGVIAHELGHIVARHATVDMTNSVSRDPWGDAGGLTAVTSSRNTIA
jgi:predicted Zn-dependent protease